MSGPRLGALSNNTWSGGSCRQLSVSFAIGFDGKFLIPYSKNKTHLGKRFWPSWVHSKWTLYQRVGKFQRGSEYIIIKKVMFLSEFSCTYNGYSFLESKIAGIFGSNGHLSKSPEIHQYHWRLNSIYHWRKNRRWYRYYRITLSQRWCWPSLLRFITVKVSNFPPQNRNFAPFLARLIAPSGDPVQKIE